MFHGHLDCFQKPPLGGRPNTKLGDHGTPNAHKCWFILLHHVWGPAWIAIHWYTMWLRALSRVTSHDTWESVTTLHDFGGALERPLDTFFRALTISRLWLLAHVGSGPKSHSTHCGVRVCVWFCVQFFLYFFPHEVNARGWVAMVPACERQPIEFLRTDKRLKTSLGE